MRSLLNTFRRFAGRKTPSVTPAETRVNWPLDQPLLRWSDRDAFTIRAACEGVVSLGSVGSGKTSAVGRSLATAYLSEGQFGFVVLCAKVDEVDWWLSLAHDAGRSDDVVLFDHPDRSPLRFNFLDYEATRQGPGAGLCENVVTILSGVNDILDMQRGSGGGDNDRFWRANDRMLLRNTVELCLLSNTPLTVDNLRQIVLSAPTSPEQTGSPTWRERAFCWKCLVAADGRAKSPRERHDLGVVADYFLKVFPETSEKTRSIFVASFGATTDLLSRGILRELFCTTTNITPECLAAGKILIVALPLREFGEAGKIAATLWKQAFMRWVERRDIRKSPRPVCLWMDEAAQLVTPGDMLFATSCRSARAALVMMGHNIGSFHVALGGGEKGRAETDGLFGAMNTKIFCANSDFETCTWAANLIGKAAKLFINAGQSYQPQDWLGAMTGMGHEPSTNSGMSEQMDYLVAPSEFAALATGGPANRGRVETIVHQSGRSFATTATNWMRVAFQQSL
jgi:hypothetical protein